MVNRPKWFQGYFTTPGSDRRVYEGDGLSNRLVATFERAEDAAEVARMIHNDVSATYLTYLATAQAAEALETSLADAVEALRLASNKFAFAVGLADPLNKEMFLRGAKRFCDEAIAKAEAHK